MKILFTIVLISILCITNVNGDTIDVWYVSYNNEIIKDYSFYNQSPLVLKKSEIKADDILSVSYNTDTPCWDCTNYLFIYDDKKNKIVFTKSVGEGSPLTFKIQKLLDSIIENGSTIFKVSYFQDDIEYIRIIFEIKIE